MNRLSLIIGMTLLTGIGAQADIIVVNPVVTGSGPFVWSYDFLLSSNQDVNSGVAPPTNPVSSDLTIGGFATIYDFAGYVAGSCAGPAGWTCTAQNVGYTPDTLVPTDNPNITNITWAYTSGPTIDGVSPFVDLGLFLATSLYSTPIQVSYTGRGILNTGPGAGTVSANVGATNGPEATTPEPATGAVIGLGLIGIACLKRRFGMRV
jgi:hypothetical protein